MQDGPCAEGEAIDIPAKLPRSFCSLQMSSHSYASKACQLRTLLFCCPLAKVSFPRQSTLKQGLAVAVQIRAVRDADKAASGVL